MQLRCAAAMLVVLARCAASLAAADDDDKPVPAASGAAFNDTSELTSAQRESAGILTAHPVAARLAGQQSAFGQVLDPAALVSEHGQLQAALAAEHAANADLNRLQSLYRAEAASSLRMVQAAEAEHTRARTQYEAAQVTFNAHWGALGKLPQGQLEQLIGRAADGSHLLLRANLLGRQSLGVLPQGALLEVDGARVAAKVIGILPAGAAEVQSAAVLLETGAAPRGLGPGARMPVTLLYAPGSGVLIPDQSLLYTEQGPRIFTQQAGSDGGHWRYRQVPVELLQRRPGGWLVRGVDDDDQLVVRGAGALWSLPKSANTQASSADDSD